MEDLVVGYVVGAAQVIGASWGAQCTEPCYCAICLAWFLGTMVAVTLPGVWVHRTGQRGDALEGIRYQSEFTRTWVKGVDVEGPAPYSGYHNEQRKGT